MHEFVRLAEQHGLPRVATVQNVYSLISRGYRTGWTRRCTGWACRCWRIRRWRFGLLTGKYDQSGIEGPDAPKARGFRATNRCASSVGAAPIRCARPSATTSWPADNGLTPTQLALAFCYMKWQVASTIIGVTSVAQLEEDLDVYGTTLSAEILAEIDKIRWEVRDPAA